MLPGWSVNNSREARWRGRVVAAATIGVSSQIRRAPGQHLHAIRLAIEIHALAPFEQAERNTANVSVLVA